MQSFDEKQRKYKDDIEAALLRYLPQTDEPYKSVVEAMRYSVLGGGKRIRAILLIEFCVACGGTEDMAMPFACALEMIHAYSLVHDDLPCMDNDVLRRGKPSCWKAFGETTALLAGDGLLTKAFEVAAQSNAPPQNVLRAVCELAKNAGDTGMLGGQVMDLESEGSIVSEDVLTRIYKQKTGALLCGGARIGCILAGADEDKILLSGRYADKIGLAFQIVDDILDITSDEKTLGKPIGSDAENKKNTYTTLHGVQSAKEKVNELTAQAQELLRSFAFKDDFLYTMTENLALREN